MCLGQRLRLQNSIIRCCFCNLVTALKSYKNMEEFLSLYKKFKSGLKWISGSMASKPMNPWLKSEIDRFERDVVDPMDREFEKLNQEIRLSFIRSEK